MSNRILCQFLFISLIGICPFVVAEDIRTDQLTWQNLAKVNVKNITEMAVTSVIKEHPEINRDNLILLTIALFYLPSTENVPIIHVVLGDISGYEGNNPDQLITYWNIDIPPENSSEEIKVWSYEGVHFDEIPRSNK